MMSGLRQLCALAVFCGVAMSLIPEGSVRKLASIGCALVLLLSLAGSVQKLDPSAYSLELAKYRQLEKELGEQADQTRDRLDRRVIEEEFAAYITDKAEETDVSIREVRVTVRWSVEGVWVPYSVILQASGRSEDKARLAQRIEAELGIPAERQEWLDDGED